MARIRFFRRHLQFFDEHVDVRHRKHEYRSDQKRDQVRSSKLPGSGVLLDESGGERKAQDVAAKAEVVHGHEDSIEADESASGIAVEVPGDEIRDHCNGDGGRVGEDGLDLFHGDAFNKHHSLETREGEAIWPGAAQVSVL